MNSKKRGVALYQKKLGKFFLGLNSLFSEKRRYRLLLEISSRYRLNPITTEDPSPRTTKKIIDAGKKWKTNQKHLIDQNLTLKEIERLSQADRYPNFFKILLKSNNLLNSFFNWVLRDGNRFDIFVYFPEEALLLLDSNLSNRIGSLSKNALKISSEYPKTLSLLIEGRYEILDDLDRKITFKNDYSLTLKEVFKIFQNKEFDGGNLEFMKEGIVNWSPVHLGPWNPKSNSWDVVDLKSSEWYKKLPIFQNISHEEVIARYGQNPKNEEWIVSTCATRGSRNLDFNNTHAFLEIAIPDGRGSWSYYDFGKMAIDLPQNTFDLLKMLCKLSPATIAYPDENVYYTFRQNDKLSLIISNKDGMRILGVIKEDLNRSRQGTLLYQIETDNCAKWVFETVIKVLGKFAFPNYYWMPLLETEAGGVMGAIFRFIAWLPTSLQLPVMKLGHLAAGAFRTTVVIDGEKEIKRAVIFEDLFYHGHIYLPALLIHKLEERMLKTILDRFRRMIKRLQGLSFPELVKIWLKTPLSKDRYLITLNLWQTFATPLMNFASSQMQKKYSLSINKENGLALAQYEKRWLKDFA